MKKVKAFVFDIGGVLQLNKDKHFTKEGSRKSVHQEIANKLNIGLDQWFDSIDTNYALSIIGKISKKKFLSITAKNLQINPEKLEKIIKAPYKNRYVFNKELYSYCINLKKQGYKIAVLSDQWILSQEVLANPQDYKGFNPFILSCDVGIRKPDPRIFKLTLKRLKLKPNQVVFVDNQKWNIDAAKKLGIRTVHYKNNKQAFREMNKLIK